MKRKKTHSSFVAVVPALLVSCFRSSEKEIVYGNPPGWGGDRKKESEDSPPADVVTARPEVTQEAKPEVATETKEHGKAAECPKDIGALREASCEPAEAVLPCHYGKCMNGPAMTATCDAETKKWKESWVACNPPAPENPKKPGTPSKKPE